MCCLQIEGSLTAVQRRVIYPCNAANRDIHDFFVKVVSPAESRIHVFANCRRCELSLSCPDIIIYLHVTRLSHAGCSFCNLIGLPESKTADSAQPRNRSICNSHQTLLPYGWGLGTSYPPLKYGWFTRLFPYLCLTSRSSGAGVLFR